VRSSGFGPSADSWTYKLAGWLPRYFEDEIAMALNPGLLILLRQIQLPAAANFVVGTYALLLARRSIRRLTPIKSGVRLVRREAETGGRS
jgi:hypothetical protein